jgi:hypothetical protein
MQATGIAKEVLILRQSPFGFDFLKAEPVCRVRASRFLTGLSALVGMTSLSYQHDGA